MPQRQKQAAQGRVGQVVGGKYHLLEVLGTGGMGMVYRAQNTWTRGLVAVKLLRPEFSADQDAVGRFLREAQAVAQLTHPNIIQVLDLGEDPDEDCLFMVQELLQGQSLKARLDQKGRLRPEEALDLVVPVMAGLVVAHSRGIVHRDLKPENIFLARTPAGHTLPKVLDFGISKVEAELTDYAQKTEAGVAVGTPVYMSPEQFEGAPDIDGRTDVWSMGVVLYELLSGSLPFGGGNLVALAARVAHGECRPLGEVAPALSGALAEVVHRALRPDRRTRLATMREFVDSLISVALVDGTDLLVRHKSALIHRSAELASTLGRSGTTSETLTAIDAPAAPDANDERTLDDDEAAKVPMHLIRQAAGVDPLGQTELQARDTPRDPPPGPETADGTDERAGPAADSGPVSWSSEIPTAPRPAAPELSGQRTMAVAHSSEEPAAGRQTAAVAPPGPRRSTVKLALLVAIAMAGIAIALWLAH
jgi:serine/threonine-protein kinase